MYVHFLGHSPSRKPIWPPWEVRIKAILVFCFAISTGIAEEIKQGRGREKEYSHILIKLFGSNGT